MSEGQPFRLAAGGAIDRSRPLRFTWSGRTYTGYAGDTLASALIANGVKVVGRSFKYHRPRGLIAAGVEESNALVQLGEGARSTPNIRATEVELYEGLVARPVNCWPSAEFDVGGVINLASRFLIAGFYYKTFMWPSWHLFEGLIRRMAGLGKVAPEADPDRYEDRFAHFDVVVIGAGPAGLTAALAAAAVGRRVALVEQDCLLGGSLLQDSAIIDGLDGDAWIAAARETLAAAGATILTRTVATGYFDCNALALLEGLDPGRHGADTPRYRLWQVRAGRVILATGAIERPLVFSGNDRPGVMLAGAVRHYVRRFAALPGRRFLVFANNDDAWRTAEALADAGAQVVAVVDTRRDLPPDCVSRMAAREIPVFAGAAVIETNGYKRLRSARVRHATGQVTDIACDGIAMSGGFSPTIHLFGQAGGKLRYDKDLAAFVPATCPQAAVCVGAAAGRFDLADLLENARAAGEGRPATKPARVAFGIQPAWQIGGSGKAFVDFQNDVTAQDIALSARESFRSVEHLKRYTTLGMAPDQGKTSNVNALAIMADETGRTVAETGTTRFRFPYTPMPLASFAGRARGELFRPLRRMPGHARHEALGAVFEDIGGYLRPIGYPQAGESRHDTEQREAAAVRAGAGLFEGSPLGKLEVVGRDAGAFLDRIYANRVSNLALGKIRYGLMLNELGIIIDDGVVTRLAEDCFLVSTTSGGADRIAAWLEEWLQCEWVDLDVVVAPVTTAWGVLTLTGPHARAILEAVGTSIDISRASFPHMSFRKGEVAGMSARVHRVSFTGELSYEVAVASSRVPLLWDSLIAAGRNRGIVPVGLDAWMVLRTEKGYLHVGGDTDGTTTPLNVGWDHVLKKASDFVGRRSLTLPHNRQEDRLQLVGLAADDGKILPIGAHMLDAAGRSQGYVTSSHFSPTLGHGVALGMLNGGARRIGETVTLRTLKGLERVRVAPPCAYDPAGDRLNG